MPTKARTDLILAEEQPVSIGRARYKLRRKYLLKGNPLGFACTLFGDASTTLDRILD